MRLKQIKLAGFKSFVDATTVPFPDQMTAIVGPNGCGKSNVIDAVRWVLGESSAKNLRGDAMTDVIFNGSTNRKPVSQASVELVFDNAEGRLQGSLADRNEISVKRQVNKEAQSTYFLNGSKCRRRDITDIFLGTGLGPRSYAIIEQGMISRLIESKPQELRVFIEEAAGISKYKERRRETENRIKHTRDNLERLEDVREELGAQLEKLKRQAATARRFKDLKAKERKYKSELYALKWHKYNEQLNLFEKEKMEKEAKLEAFISEQRGGELGMLQLKEQHQSLSDKVQSAQQLVYQIGTQITRLEQQIVFSQEKHQNQQEEKLQLESTIAESKEHLEFEIEKVELLAEQLELLTPELELQEEQLAEANEQLLVAEQEYENWLADWERQQKIASQSQQSAQVIQTKIHAQTSQLERSKQRQLDLQREISDIDNPELEQELLAAQQRGSEVTERINQSSVELDAQQGLVNTAQSELIAAEQNFQKKAQEQQTIQIKLESLESWLLSYKQSNSEDLEQLLTEQGIASLGAMLTQLEVEDDWQQAIESVLSHHGSAIVVNQLPTSASSGQFIKATSVRARPNSAASVIKSGVYPAWLNQVGLLSNIAELASTLEQGFFSGLDQTGNWYGENWLSASSIESGDTDVLARMSELEHLSGQAQEYTELMTDMKVTVDQKQEALSQLLDQQTQLQQVLDSDKQLQMELNMQIRLQQQQIQQNATLKQKLHDELEQVAEQIELEQESIFMLEQELELGQEQSIELTQHLEQLEQDKLSLQEQVSSAKQQTERLKNESHQFALKQQTLKSQHDAVSQNVSRAKQHQLQLEQKLAGIAASLEGEQDPTIDLKLELEEQLQSRLEAEEVLAECQNQLAEVAEKIAQLEQGQSGILAKLDSMRAEIESIKLDSEGARIRAQNMLETLSDMEQPLKPILESMPVEANEEEWSLELEKATSAISRLGAINLAAIEEYDIQAERKGYLDEQYQDLVDALDTLESAIRKIDRESRAKFKETYDKVNADLQMLFPKVFGGGSAYLELTADDLLETGVTIMARPPGKKNSTIHLLSGGEKALTALSLVFSIFRLNPAPFCMLDEVDAPLDDANVGRFCKLVQEMSETVQFIYISHNKVAMEMATHLTGVTMQEPGVSRLVAVDIQEAVQMAEA